MITQSHRHRTFFSQRVRVALLQLENQENIFSIRHASRIPPRTSFHASKCQTGSPTDRGRAIQCYARRHYFSQRRLITSLGTPIISQIKIDACNNSRRAAPRVSGRHLLAEAQGRREASVSCLFFKVRGHVAVRINIATACKCIFTFDDSRIDNAIIVLRANENSVLRWRLMKYMLDGSKTQIGGTLMPDRRTVTAILVVVVTRVYRRVTIALPDGCARVNP